MKQHTSGISVTKIWILWLISSYMNFRIGKEGIHLCKERCESKIKGRDMLVPLADDMIRDSERYDRVRSD